MKKFFIVMVMLIFLSICLAVNLETVNDSAMLVSSADSNDSALDINTTCWADTATWPEISQRANGLKVKFYAYDPNEPNDETFSYEFYVADYGSSAEKVAAGDANVGDAHLSHNPVTLAELNSGSADPNYCWVDTLGTITSDWKKAPQTQNNDGLNDVASFIFHRESGRKAWCRIYDRSSPYLVVYCIVYYY